MQFIVLDLEWNQPTSYQSSVFRKIGDSLLFEVIQIGAVKLGEDFSILDAISIPVRPTHYLAIHPRVRRMTRLGQEELCDAPEFPEAMERFSDWCGEDYVSPGLRRRERAAAECGLFRFERPLPKMYDIQRLYAQVQGLKANQQKASKAPWSSWRFRRTRTAAFTTPCTTPTIRPWCGRSCRTPPPCWPFPGAPEMCHNQKRLRFRLTQMVPRGPGPAPRHPLPGMPHL